MLFGRLLASPRLSAAAAMLPRRRHEKIAGFVRLDRRPALNERQNSMDAERINQIGSRIDDLRARADALRGYL